MPFTIKVRVPRHPETDVVGYRFYRQGGATAPDVKVAEGVQPSQGDPELTFTVPEPKFSATFVATALDSANNESPKSVALAISGDSVAPAAPGAPSLVSLAWTP